MSTPAQPMPWSEAVRAPDAPERERFLESHIDLVRYLALRISARLPSSVELDDLVHDGILGLLDAVEKYDPTRKVLFRTYAETRIRGAILDGLRQKDWRPRSVRSAQRRLDSAVGELSSLHRRAATEEEVAEALGLPLDAYRELLRETSMGTVLSLEDLPPGADAAVTEESQLPDVPLERLDLVRALGEEIVNLPERERRVLELYYHERLNMKEVGVVLGITESRVCQLHAQAAARLRVALQARLHVAPAGAPVRARGGR